MEKELKELHYNFCETAYIPKQLYDAVWNLIEDEKVLWSESNRDILDKLEAELGTTVYEINRTLE